MAASGAALMSESIRAGSNSEMTREADNHTVELSVLSSDNSSRAALSTFGWRASTSPREIWPIWPKASASATQANKRLSAGADEPA